MKKIIKYFFSLLVCVNLIVFLTGKEWLYKGVNITYLRGYVSSYIDDFVYFSADTIKAGKHQEWLVSNDYNKSILPEFINTTNKKLETVAFLVIQNDSIKHENYWHGYSADTMSNSFSMAKSWVATLIGVAINEGKIKSLDQSACDFIPDFCNDHNSKITIKHLLTMSSGLNWKEDYHNPIGQTAEAYYGNKIKKLVFNLKSVEEPGKVFKYHSSCTQLLCFILESATEKSLSEYASEKLWRPMGAKHDALWSTDRPGGDEKGFCCINSNARDFARIGRLYLNFGNWNGVQILDSSFVKDATKAANLIDIKDNKNKKYGYQFWITNYKNLNIYYARGLWGQYVICIPEKNMIIVRLGRKQEELLENGHHKDLFKFIDAALELDAFA